MKLMEEPVVAHAGKLAFTACASPALVVKLPAVGNNVLANERL